MSLTWEAKGRSRGRNDSPQLQGQQAWKLQNSAKTPVNACRGWLLPSVKPHILPVVFTAVFHCTTEGPRTAAFLHRFLKGTISPLVYRHACFCFSALSCSLLLSSRPSASDLSPHMPFVSLSLFPLGSVSFLYCQNTNVNGMLDGRNWFSVLDLDYRHDKTAPSLAAFLPGKHAYFQYFQPQAFKISGHRPRQMMKLLSQSQDCVKKDPTPKLLLFFLLHFLGFINSQLFFKVLPCSYTAFSGFSL